jgi:hypothetical protein
MVQVVDEMTEKNQTEHQCLACWGYNYRIRTGKGQTVNAYAAQMLGIKGAHVDCTSCADKRKAAAAAKASL